MSASYRLLVDIDRATSPPVDVCLNSSATRDQGLDRAENLQRSTVRRNRDNRITRVSFLNERDRHTSVRGVGKYNLLRSELGALADSQQVDARESTGQYC